MLTVNYTFLSLGVAVCACKGTNFVYYCVHFYLRLLWVLICIHTVSMSDCTTLQCVLQHTPSMTHQGRSCDCGLEGSRTSLRASQDISSSNQIPFFCFSLAPSARMHVGSVHRELSVLQDVHVTSLHEASSFAEILPQGFFFLTLLC